jgi:parvulin-like peptidyl-prolyl isomerase
MSPLPRLRRRALAMSLVAVFALAACSGGEEPAATIGPHEISDARLRFDTKLYTFLTGLSGAPCGTPVGDESNASACARFTLGNDIREEIVKEYATAHDLTVDQADIDTAIEQVSQSVGGVEELDRQLAEQGLEHQDLVTLARRLLLFNEAEQAIAAERVTDDILLPLYESQKEQFSNVEVSHILVETEDEARAIAALVSPQNFAEVAADRSIDTQSGENGGSLGMVSQAEFLQTFDQTFAQAALSLEEGEISAPVQTQFGWHIIEMTRRDEASFEDVREQLVGQVEQQVFQDWLAERAQAMGIEVNPRYGRFDSETGNVEPIRSTGTGPSGASATGGTGIGGATGGTGGATGATAAPTGATP